MIYMYCIYDVYTKNKQCSIYNEYAWYITGISQPDGYITWYIPCIYMVYQGHMVTSSIWQVYIPCKIKWVCSISFFIRYTSNIP